MFPIYRDSASAMRTTTYILIITFIHPYVFTALALKSYTDYFILHGVHMYVGRLIIDKITVK